MTLYIYRVGWTYPARNPITDLNLQRVLVVLGFQVDRSDRSDPPVRPVGVARPATWSRPVRPVCSTSANFGRQHMPTYFFGDASMPKNKPLDQNCLKTMINMHRPYFVLRAINSIGHILLLFQADDETTCLGLHTYFMVADLTGTTSACCSIDSFLRIRYSLLFWM